MEEEPRRLAGYLAEAETRPTRAIKALAEDLNRRGYPARWVGILDEAVRYR